MQAARSVFAVLLFGGLVSACRLARTAAEAPGRLASAGSGGDKDAKLDPWAMSQWMMGFADTASSEIEGATQEFAERVGDDEARVQALEWQIEYTTLAIQLATSPQPYDGFFSALLALSVLRSIDEPRWQADWGDASRPLSEALERLESLAWGKAEQILDEGQLSEIRRIIEQWLQTNPDTHATTLPQFQEIFARGQGAEQGGEQDGGFMGELTGLLSIDPLASLEPAARQVELARQFAERMFFHLQRAPKLLEAQAELLALRASSSSEARSLLDDAERVSRAAESFAGTADTLPEDLGAELTRQREGLVRDLETAKDPALELLGSTRTTLEAARETSIALADAVRAFDTLMGRFERPEEPPPAVEEPPGKPFDIAEYGAAAEKIGAAAHELTAAIATLDGSLPALEGTLSTAALRAQDTLDRAYRRALQLLIVALGGGLLVWLAATWVRDRRRTIAR